MASKSRISRARRAAVVGHSALAGLDLELLADRVAEAVVSKTPRAGALLSIEQVQSMLGGISHDTLARLRRGEIDGTPEFPLPRACGARRMWVSDDVAAWVRSLPTDVEFIKARASAA